MTAWFSFVVFLFLEFILRSYFFIIVEKRVGVNEGRAVLFPSVSYFVSSEIDPYIKSIA